MSTNELKIFKELEKDVERDLEEEIKDNIYHLAFKLHRFYQHQNERYESESLESNTKKQNNKILSELNINIKMENGTKIEIKETKNGITKVTPRRRLMTPTSVNVKKLVPSNKKKFNWESTLRSEPLVTNIGSPTKQKCVKRDSESNKVLAHSMEKMAIKRSLKKQTLREKNDLS